MHWKRAFERDACPQKEAAYLISCIRAATSGLATGWARSLTFVAPVLVLGAIGLVWSDRHEEPATFEAHDQPLTTSSTTPVAQDDQRDEAEPYAPPVSPLPVSEPVEPKFGEPVDR